MKQGKLFRGFNKKGIFFICLLSLLLFATNASAYLSSYSFNLIYASADLNGGAMDNYATVTVELTNTDQATIIFDTLDGYRLQNRAGVELNAFLFSVSNLSNGELVNKGEGKNFSEFGHFNASFTKLDKLTSFRFDVTKVHDPKQEPNPEYWTDAKQVLRINDQGYKAVAHIVPQQGDSGYAAGNGSAVPLPGAVWLLGSGLVGLVAIRRRHTA